MIKTTNILKTRPILKQTHATHSKKAFSPHSFVNFVWNQDYVRALIIRRKPEKRAGYLILNQLFTAPARQFLKSKLHKISIFELVFFEKQGFGKKALK